MPFHQNILLAPGRKPRSSLLFFSFFIFFVPPACSEYIMIQTSVQLQFHYYIFSHKTVASFRPQRGTCFHLCQLGMAGAPHARRSCVGRNGGEALQIPMHRGWRGLARSKSGRAFPVSLSHCLLCQGSSAEWRAMRVGFLSPHFRCLKVRCLNLFSWTGFLHSQWRQIGTSSVWFISPILHIYLEKGWLTLQPSTASLLWL